MRYADIKFPDVANGSGVRVSLFVQGCKRHCKGCFNKETWNFRKGKPFTQKEKDYIFSILDQPYIAGLSVLGGEPLEQGPELEEFLKEVYGRYPDKNIWMWTGYTFEDVSDRTIFKYVDYVVDGPFIESKKNLDLVFRGSSNQRIIHINKE